MCTSHENVGKNISNEYSQYSYQHFYIYLTLLDTLQISSKRLHTMLISRYQQKH